MGNKFHVMGDKISVTDDRKAEKYMNTAIFKDPLFAGKSAKIMSKDLIQAESRGVGDTLEATAHRLQTKHGIESNVIMQGWSREPRDMKSSRWLPLFAAWVDRIYTAERAKHENTTPIARLADLVAGKKNEEFN